MDWKVITAVVLFVFGLIGFSMYQSANTDMPTGAAVADTCLGDSCSVVDTALLDQHAEAEVEEEAVPIPAQGVTHEITSLEDGELILVNEGDAVVIRLDAVDPDGDALYYSFAEPFNKKGEWQTANGDAGKYVVEVTVTDGEYIVPQNITVVVNSVNFPPVIHTVSNGASTLQLEETDELTISVEASDDDGDAIKYTWILDGRVISNEKDLTHVFGYDDAGRKVLKVVASDDKNESSRKWTIRVNEKNRAPVLEVEEEHTVAENEPVELKAKVTDPDGDEVSITYPLPFDEKGMWKTDYSSEGTHEYTLSASDGKVTTTQKVVVVVSNKNREPTLEGTDSITVYEGQSVRASFSAKDADGEETKLTYGTPLNADGVWETSYDDAGDYTAVISATDGDATTEKEFRIKVVNVNRAPVIYPLADLEVTETDLVAVKVTAADPDEDDVSLQFSSPLSEDGTWQTDYDSAGEYTITVTASDGKDEASSTFTLTVKNKNRPPQILGVSN